MEHQCEHEDDFNRIQKDHDEFVKIANSHVTWTTYWAITLVMIGIITAVVSFILNEKHAEHDMFESKLEKLEARTNDNNLQYATLLVEVKQVQAQLSSLQADLKQHDK